MPDGELEFRPRIEPDIDLSEAEDQIAAMKRAIEDMAQDQPYMPEQAAVEAAADTAAAAETAAENAAQTLAETEAANARRLAANEADIAAGGKYHHFVSSGRIEKTESELWEDYGTAQKNISLLNRLNKSDPAAIKTIMSNEEFSDIRQYLADPESGIKAQRSDMAGALIAMGVPKETAAALFGTDDEAKEDRIADKHATAFVSTLSRAASAFGGQSAGAAVGGLGGILMGAGAAGLFGTALTIALPTIMAAKEGARDYDKAMADMLVREPEIAELIQSDAQLYIDELNARNIGMPMPKRYAGLSSLSKMLGISAIDALPAEDMMELLTARGLDPGTAMQIAGTRGVPVHYGMGGEELALAQLAGQDMDLQTWFPQRQAMETNRQNVLMRDLTQSETQDLARTQAGIAEIGGEWSASNAAQIEAQQEGAARGAGGRAEAFLMRVFADLPGGDKSYESWLTWKDAIGPRQMGQIRSYAEKTLGPGWKVVLRELGLIQNMQSAPYLGASKELSFDLPGGGSVDPEDVAGIDDAFRADAVSRMFQTPSGANILYNAASESVAAEKGHFVQGIAYAKDRSLAAIGGYTPAGQEFTGIQIANGTGGYVFQVQVMKDDAAANGPVMPAPGFGMNPAELNQR